MSNQDFESVLGTTPEEYKDRVSKMDSGSLVSEFRSKVYSAKTRNYIWEDVHNKAAQIVEDELLKRLGKGNKPALSEPLPLLLRFTASNGITLELYGDGKTVGGNYGDPEWVQAMLEMFWHDKEKQIATWRYPANPNIVVIRCNHRDERDERWCYAYDIRTIGNGSWFCSDHSDSGNEKSNEKHIATHEYFRTNPIEG